ncbi:MAG TPA: ATP-binding cassette domain-containing protein, partial [Rhodopila sp.]|nr:ATP-binding cassette domain-containing protein [Rhodopila sp.]
MPISAPEPLLEVSGLAAGYGKIAVLHDVALRIGKGEVVSLLGPNGAGKTTLLSALSGLLP